MSLRIKKGDTAIILKGKDRGKRAKVVKVWPRQERLLLEGVNLQKRHRRPRRAGEKGQIITVAAPLHISNVALYCSRCGRGVRFGVKVADGKKYRVCRRCGNEL